MLCNYILTMFGSQHFGRVFISAYQLEMPFRCVGYKGYKCGNKQGLCDWSFHRFPEDRREAWEAAIQREGWKSLEYSRLCGAHFIKGKYHNMN